MTTSPVRTRGCGSRDVGNWVFHVTQDFVYRDHLLRAGEHPVTGDGPAADFLRAAYDAGVLSMHYADYVKWLTQLVPVADEDEPEPAPAPQRREGRKPSSATEEEARRIAKERAWLKAEKKAEKEREAVELARAQAEHAAAEERLRKEAERQGRIAERSMRIESERLAWQARLREEGRRRVPVEPMGPSPEDADFEVTFIVRNRRLKQAILRAGFPSVAQFAKASGTSLTAIYGYLGLKVAPYRYGGKPRHDAVKIAAALSAEIEDLFPERFLTRVLERNRITFALTEGQIVELIGQVPRSPEELLSIDEAGELVMEAVQQLPKRECEVLTMRLGLDGKAEQTMDEVAVKMGNVSRERIRQIEQSALRKLRHPARLPKLLVAARLLNVEVD